MISAGESPVVSRQVGGKVCAEVAVLVGETQMAGKTVCGEAKDDEVLAQSRAYREAWLTGEVLQTKFQGSTIRVSAMSKEQTIAYLQSEQKRIEAERKMIAEAARTEPIADRYAAMSSKSLP